MNDAGCLCRECANIFKGKQIEKGIAFPTCVSINR
jgi:methionine aminopeptidase